MSTLERERTVKRIADEPLRDRAAVEYYMMMSAVTGHIESSNVFRHLAEARARNLMNNAGRTSLK